MTEDGAAPKTEKALNPDVIFGTWTCLGAGLGVVIGLISGHLVWGLVMGPSLGVALGVALIQQAKAKARRTLIDRESSREV